MQGRPAPALALPFDVAGGHGREAARAAAAVVPPAGPIVIVVRRLPEAIGGSGHLLVAALIEAGRRSRCPRQGRVRDRERMH